MPVVQCTCDAPARRQQAAAMAGQLGLPLNGEPAAGDLILELTDSRLQLRLAGSRMGPVFCDFLTGAVGYRRRNSQGQIGLLCKAIGTCRGSTSAVIDATAGLGSDTIMLASIGCRVTAIERSPLIAALLRDGLSRGAADPVVRSVRLVEDDAHHYLGSLHADARPDVVYMDPMFPHRSKSAQVGKEMVICRMAAGDDDDASTLLIAALAAAQQRVVVKRPLRAPSLDGPAPSHAIRGTSIRFDVYVRS